MTLHRNKNALLILAILVLALAPHALNAETLSSPNYNVENPQFDSGGESSNSTNYSSRESIGADTDSGSSSTNFKTFWGFILQSYPGVPGVPTLTNTGGSLYNALDFVVTTGGNTTDVNYAIAISDDNFVTTNYIQADDTVGSGTVWQSYTAWGSSTGQRVTGLAPSTTYKIKVKARYGADSETGFSNTASATTSSPSLTVTIAGVSLGNTIASETTTISTTTSAMNFTTLPVGSAVVAAQSISVTTNASGGYTTTLQQDGHLRKSNGDDIDPVAASNASPAAWPGAIITGAFGYHTTDSLLCTGTVSRFALDNTYAAATSTPSEVACTTTAATSDQTYLVYKLEIGSLQQAGSYNNNITYITTAIF